MSREALFAALNKSASNLDADLVKVAIAADLTILVQRAGLKRSEIAKRLGWTRGRVSQVLSGEGNLTVETIQAVAKAAGFAFDVVFRAEDSARALQLWERSTHCEPDEPEVDRSMTLASATADARPLRPKPVRRATRRRLGSKSLAG